MNAYELADKLNLFWHTENDKLFEDAATMLRQQQTEIDMLKKLLDDFGITVNRKPAKYSAEWWSGVKEYNEQRKKNK